MTTNPGARNFMPPYLVLRNFLEEETAADLLEHALILEREFVSTGVGAAETRKIDETVRISVATRDLGIFRPIFKAKMLGNLPKFVAELQTTAVDAPRLETQLVAHNDGAFYKRHIDTQMVSRRDHVRVLSGVYYFHAKPKAFAGGALRLYSIGKAEKEIFVDIEPEHNSFVVFPAWAPHEVMPVSCPSKRFSDSRFAINCWVYDKKTSPQAATNMAQPEKQT
jgi:Rps23 Pro-64 3,4-dihydroxylase Tpa1-like proline 4-hydroxylase